MMQRTMQVAVCALTLGLGASGCSNSTGDANLSCDLAPASEVAAALGLTGLSAPVSETKYSVTVCSYGLDTNARAVIIKLDRGTDAAGFAAGKQSFVKYGVPVTDVPGLGDAAYFSAAGSPSVESNTLAALRGSTSVLITSSATPAQEEALARKLLSRL